jgi:hypothetical protein
MNERDRWRFLLYAGAAALAFVVAFNLWLCGQVTGAVMAGVVSLIMVDQAADATRGE